MSLSLLFSFKSHWDKSLHYLHYLWRKHIGLDFASCRKYADVAVCFCYKVSVCFCYKGGLPGENGSCI